jgi:hypothetical protein
VAGAVGQDRQPRLEAVAEFQVLLDLLDQKVDILSRGHGQGQLRLLRLTSGEEVVGGVGVVHVLGLRHRGLLRLDGGERLLRLLCFLFFSGVLFTLCFRITKSACLFLPGRMQRRPGKHRKLGQRFKKSEFSKLLNGSLFVFQNEIACLIVRFQQCLSRLKFGNSLLLLLIFFEKLKKVSFRKFAPHRLSLGE